jgi:hypothetical protein
MISGWIGLSGGGCGIMWTSQEKKPTWRFKGAYHITRIWEDQALRAYRCEKCKLFLFYEKNEKSQ